MNGVTKRPAPTNNPCLEQINRKRAILLPLCFQLLGAAQEPQTEQHASSAENSPDLWRCPKCGEPMKVIEMLTAAEIQPRSPPVVTDAAWGDSL
jgi:rubredoxin